MELIGDKIERLRAAFAHDGFEFDRDKDVVVYPSGDDTGAIGVRADHHRARNYETGQPKQAYYVEGTPYEMGWLIGKMAEPKYIAWLTSTSETSFSISSAWIWGDRRRKSSPGGSTE